MIVNVQYYSRSVPVISSSPVSEMPNGLYRPIEYNLYNGEAVVTALKARNFHLDNKISDRHLDLKIPLTSRSRTVKSFPRWDAGLEKAAQGTHGLKSERVEGFPHDSDKIASF